MTLRDHEAYNCANRYRSCQRPTKDWIRRSSASVMTHLKKIAAIQLSFLGKQSIPYAVGVGQ